MELLKNAREAIVSEYERYHTLLDGVESSSDPNEVGHWSVRYLMKEGQWCSEELQYEKFVKTMEVLLSLPLIENRYVISYCS
jgi:hypothetical protein